MKKNYIKHSEKNISFFPASWKFLIIFGSFLAFGLQSNATKSISASGHNPVKSVNPGCNLQLTTQDDLNEVPDDNCQYAIPDYTVSGYITFTNDDCGTFTLTQDIPPGTSVNDGTVVTITLTDDNDNSQFVTSTITVGSFIDLTPPVITYCIPSDAGTVDDGCNFFVPDYTTTVTATDNCTPANQLFIWQSPTAGSNIGIGATTVDVYVDDLNGNESVCEFTLTVSDNIAPTITVCPPDENDNADATCLFSVPDYTSGIAQGFDNCTAVTWSQDVAAGTLIGLGITTVTMTATDDYGNSSTCSFNITVTDVDVPNFDFSPYDDYEYLDNNCSFTVFDYVAFEGITGTDNCGTVNFTQDPPIGTQISGVGTTTVTITADDGNGNTNSASFNLFLIDVNSPDISCIGDQFVSTDGGVCTYTLPDYIVQSIISDNCTNYNNLIINQIPSAGTAIGVGITTVEIDVTDESGNSNFCTFNINVADNEAPVISVCPNDDQQYADAVCSQYSLPDYSLQANATDNCGFTWSQNPAPGTGIGLGITSVTLTATDGNGNSAACNFNAILTDNSSPNFTCPGDDNEVLDANCSFTLPDYTIGVVATDNCGSVTLSQDPAPGTTLYGVGSYTVTMYADDGLGNTSSCPFNVNLTDNTPPLLFCPGDDFESADNSCSFTVPDYSVVAFASDNCGNIYWSQTPTVNTTVGLGSTTVTLYAGDGNGNTSSCSFNLIVNDNTPPNITCPGDQNVSAGNTCSYILLNYTSMVSASDNCGTANLSQDLPAGTIVGLGTTTVTITADDGNGNQNNCTINIIVSDNSAPTINCAANATRSGNCSYTVSGSEFDATAGDNCGVSSLAYSLSGATSGTGSNTLANTVLNLGTTTITWTASDGTNTATCSSSVTVNQLSNALPYTEIFTTQDCWSVQHISGGSGDWTFGNTMNTNLAPASGEMMVFPSSTSSNGTRSRLISPLLNFTGVAEPVLNYHFATDNGSQQPDSVAVSISTDGGSTYTFLRSALRKRASAPSWSSFALDLAPYGNMSNIKLAFDAISAGGGNDMAIDDLNLFAATCPEPINFSSTGITSSTATVSWQTGGGSPSDYVVRWSTSISDLATWNQVTVAGNVNSYTITGMNGNTTIYWQVKADCSGNTSGFPIAYQTFHTLNCPSSVSITSSRPNLYLCSGGNMTLTATAGFTGYSWSNANTNQAITVSSANTYSVTATMSGCQSVNASVTVIQDAAINLTSPYYFSQVNENCNGGNTGIINVSPAGGFPGYTYLWSPNNATTATISNLTAGAYAVTVTDSKGCTNSKSTTLGQPSAILLGAPTHFSQSNVTGCYGNTNGIINVNPAGGTPGYTYSWTPSEGTNATISNLGAGSYTVTVTDAHGCTKTNSTSLSQPSQIKLVSPTYFSQSNVTCFGGNNGIIRVNPTGGTPGYTYSWTPSEGTNPTISNLTAGSYTVTVTDANFCTATKSTIIAQPTQILIGAPQHETQVNPTCANGHNGIIRMNPAGGTPPYSYTWSPNVGTTATVSNLSAGNYNVTVTDANGCTRTNAIVLVCTSRLEEPDGNVTLSPSFDFNVYPNPAEGLVTIAFSSDKENSYSISLIDMMGRVVKTEVDNAAIGENMHSMNLEGIAKGVYMILLQQGDNTYKSKLLVE